MKLLKTAIHPDVTDIKGNILARSAARGIVLKGENILLMFTERYNDFSLPGGGIDENESIHDGLVREMEEETGARNVQVLEEIGVYEEYRPWYKPGHDILYMLSHCFICSVDEKFDEPKFEDYELANGMKVVWKNIHEAIKHNKDVIVHSSKKAGR